MIRETNNNWVAMSDGVIIAAIGEFIKYKRLQGNKTQAKLAKDAGLNRWTLGQIEKGESVTLNSLIQVLRALNLLYLLDGFTSMPTPQIWMSWQRKESGTPMPGPTHLSAL